MKTLSNDLFFKQVEAEIGEGRNVRFRVKGTSMTPLLRNGRDEVLLSPCEPKELRPMDVALFRYKGIHVLHRIIYRDGEQLLLQGDGVCISHETCKTDDVVGIVHKVIRPTGKVIETSSFRWRLMSRLWRSLGRFRGIFLRVYHRFGISTNFSL